MRSRFLTVALAVVVIASFAGAELSQQYKDWPSTAAGFLLTKAERKAFESLKTDDEAANFIELFWAKRDPDLNTPVNEFKLDFDARVAAADKQFGFGKTPGSLSDRGRVLILMGRPSGIAGAAAGAVAGRIENPNAAERGATEVWRYSKDRLPAGVKSDEVLFIFVESRVGAQDYILDRSESRNALGMKLLAEAPERLLLHPKLTEAPKLGLLPGSKAATAEQLTIFDAADTPWPAGAAVLTTQAVLSANLNPLWTYLQLPDSQPAATQAIGRVRKASGELVGTFAMPVTPISVVGGRGYEFSFPVAPGTWTIDLALLNDAGPVAVTSFEATAKEVAAEGTQFSPFYWGVDPRQEAQAHLGDPFNVGGWHVVPRIGDSYTNKDQLSYFCYILRPTLEEGPAPTDPQAAKPEPRPNVTMSMALFMGDKKISERPEEPVNLSRISDELWMYGSGLPLSIFKKSGEFRFVVTLRDGKSGAKGVGEIPLKVTVEGQPAAPAPAPAKP